MRSGRSRRTRSSSPRTLPGGRIGSRAASSKAHASATTSRSSTWSSISPPLRQKPKPPKPAESRLGLRECRGGDAALRDAGALGDVHGYVLGVLTLEEVRRHSRCRAAVRVDLAGIRDGVGNLAANEIDDRRLVEALLLVGQERVVEVRTDCARRPGILERVARAARLDEESLTLGGVAVG